MDTPGYEHGLDSKMQLNPQQPLNQHTVHFYDLYNDPVHKSTEPAVSWAAQGLSGQKTVQGTEEKGGFQKLSHRVMEKFRDQKSIKGLSFDFVSVYTRLFLHVWLVCGSALITEERGDEALYGICSKYILCITDIFLARQFSLN